MCGIVGYLGPNNPKDVLIQGLRSLEYRGYDSAGVAILDGGKFRRVRAEGKLSNLEKKLEHEKFSGGLGIGHTRWATHGPPSERNAHPHCVKGVSIVHNGIIENYVDLKTELLAKGAEFASDTDSELVAHLLSREIDGGKTLLESVLRILPRLRGAYSILAVSEDYPDEIVAFKNGPPLIIGVNDKEVVVASDIQAIVPYTKSVYYLEDHDIAHVHSTKVIFYNAKGETMRKPRVELDWSHEKVEKSGYSHFMLKEIFEQPRAVAQALEPHIDLSQHTLRMICAGAAKGKGDDQAATQKMFADVERIFIVACGTSYYAGMAGEYMIERLAQIPVEVDIASEFRYRYPVIPPKSMVVVISQSGETADTLAAVRLAKESGTPVVCICNVKNSTIDRESDGRLYMNAGAEIGVASTKAFSATLALLAAFSLSVAKAKDRLSHQEEKEWVKGLLSAPSHMESVLAYDTFFAKAAETLKKFKGFLYMGRGINYPIALEGALKLKELAYMHAEGYAAGEMKHGPLALIDERMAIVMLAPHDELYEKTISNLEEAKARGGKVIAIGTGENARLKEIADHYLSLPEGNWMNNPLYEVIPLQLLAFHVASSLGHDVDQPRNLAKSVTVE